MNTIDLNHANSLYQSGQYTDFLEYCLSFDEIEDKATIHRIGNCYRKGEGIAKDVLKAEVWLKKAAEMGYSAAMVSLAILYSDEEEVQDINKTIAWYERGSEKGSTASMFNLAWVYHRFDSVKDMSKARQWYKLAANNGHKKGKYWFAKLALESKVPDEIDDAYRFLFECAVDEMENALSLLTRNAENGARVAQFYLGRYYTLKTDIENHEQIALDWYKKSALQGYVPAQNIILISNAEMTSKTVKEIKIETGVIAETTASNSRKLDAIASSLISMNEKLAEVRKQTFTGDAETEDNEISTTLEKSADIINATVQNSPVEKVRKQTEQLIKLFGEKVWERLLPDSRASLVSSAVLLKECEGMPPDFDYSGICITAIVALEKELKRVFSDNYIRYLKENRDFDKWPFLFQNENYYFSLGKLAQLFGYNAETQEVRNDYYGRSMEGYLRTIVKGEYCYNPIAAFVSSDNPYCFVARCLTINGRYRCKAAHSGNVSYDDAVDCCYEIYGEASAQIDAKKQSAEIISLLRELFSILK